MEVIFFLLACSLSVAAAFVGAFIWAVRAGQFDDTTSPALRVLFEPLPPATVSTPDVAEASAALPTHD